MQVHAILLPILQRMQRFPPFSSLPNNTCLQHSRALHSIQKVSSNHGIMRTSSVALGGWKGTNACYWGILSRARLATFASSFAKLTRIAGYLCLRVVKGYTQYLGKGNGTWILGGSTCSRQSIQAHLSHAPLAWMCDGPIIRICVCFSVVCVYIASRISAFLEGNGHELYGHARSQASFNAYDTLDLLFFQPALHERFWSRSRYRRRRQQQLHGRRWSWQRWEIRCVGVLTWCIMICLASLSSPFEPDSIR